MTWTIIDLSIPLAPDLPCWWPGLEPFSAEPTFRLETENVLSRNLHIEEHSGTHMDAPCHIGDGRHRPISPLTADAIPLSTLMGPARVVDVRDVRSTENGISPWIEPALIERYECAAGAIAAGDAVLFWTGWTDRRYASLNRDGRDFVERPLAGETPGWPAPSAGCLDLLARRGVRLVGVDTPTLGAIQDTFSPHQTAFRAGITPVENLCNLGSLGDKTATFLFLPLRIMASSGAPGRAVALVEER